MHSVNKHIQWYTVAHVIFISLKEAFLRLWKVKRPGQRTEHTHTHTQLLCVFKDLSFPNIPTLPLFTNLLDRSYTPGNSVLNSFGNYELGKAPSVSPWKEFQVILYEVRTRAKYGKDVKNVLPTMRSKPTQKCEVLKSTFHFRNKVGTGFTVYLYAFS